MSFQVLPPQFDQEKKSYIFKFKNPPKIEEVTTNPSKLSITEEDLTEIFTRDFLMQASKYFSKALDTELFYKRVAYTWVTEEVDLTVTGEESFRATWIPAAIVFYTNRYELTFNLVELEPVVVQSIPPGFLDGLGVPGEEMPLIPVETELPELPITEITIPFGEMSTDEKDKRELARKKIRQARLRASLARLRAEKLADRYFSRYGNFDMDGSGSELSSEEES
jgi:hypothetical protein